ncbi:alpha/beta fold hydrolase [Leucobacter chinensis]|uniref:alpha/beta fold hydrolase n=1 Tax=Leucobacter chinensis TaxID=2851010 RepID=UPI001C21F8DC|nr:alpha/beta fold hydrolase [Leucobacter chinensis]
MNDIQLHSVQTNDGRTLTGTTVGPASGIPLLFIAGAATGKRMTFGDEFLAERGLRLITMDRPGIGESSVCEGRTAATTANDYRSFVAAVTGSTEPFAAVANSQGSVFGLELAAQGALSRLVLASPADEIAFPAVHDMLPPEATMLSDLANSSPDEAAAVLRGFSAIDMEQMVMAGSHPDDVSWYQRSPFIEQYRAALAEGFANERSGYVTDTLIAMQRWNIDLNAIGCPVHVLFGVNDQTHSPDHGATLTGRIPGASRAVFDDAGGALLWSHAAIVLDAALGKLEA